MSIKQYKFYLLQELYKNGQHDVSKNLREINDFIKTKDGEEGFLAFEIKNLKRHKKIKKKPKLLFGDIWGLYDQLNPVLSQETNT